MYWAKYLLFMQKPDRKIVKITVITITFMLLISIFFGALSNIKSFSGLPKEFPGNFGFFISGILAGIFGVVGSTIILFLVILSLVFITFKINPLKSSEKLKPYFVKSKEIFRNKLKQEPINDSKEEDNTSNDNEEIQEEKEEPARIVKRNIENQGEELDPVNNPLKAYSQTLKESKENEENQSQTEIRINAFKKVKNDTNNTTEMESDEDKNDISDNTDVANEETLLPTSDENKKLVITVNETLIEDDVDLQPVNLLSTSIHDKEINYKQPTFDLLIDDEDKYEINEDELKLNARILQEKLETFKIEIENLSVTPGPVVTQYEFVPAPGIKISKIESLADDIAMALKARGIRIIAPIPGKGTVGIEIPNQKPMLVRFGSCIKSPKYQNSDYRLPLCIGKTISGEVFITDLSRMPHLLMAGATGTGKSVGINTIIASLIYKIHPKDLKFVIIDPKKVELTQYAVLKNHFLAVSPDVPNDIITDPQDAVIILKALTAEMDLRYDILSQAGQRNIFDYNKKVREGKFKNDTELVHKEMPYIIVIIDELADLMLTASKEVEAPIIRLAQLARAVGIHLVLATQRPSVDVITGIIKANFPARVSYLVASKIDSRTILDVMGAEKLLGNGDLLFQFGGSTSPIRIQNAFLSTDEVENICEFIGKQKGYSQPYMLPSLDDGTSNTDGIAREDRDALFNEAARLVVSLQQASVSLLQRRLKIGYARAGRIIDELESTGIVGPFDGSKARTVLIENEDELEHLL
jgi:S-DNA-T family DNA segregation ATPase FtsK/SpoIIIE